ncbi:Na+ driven multidrug/antimicrobial extrusion protein MatE [Neoasaia chiangmaiensis NBRC 101099]|nr:Na+ driven multidrug/antimicrobial extrusion protein MatE [Neoasaia chiangmaiensis NBRC 101099]GEN15701.1 MATE family efflux transporter [Neoasaia chiangmaiensis]
MSQSTTLSTRPTEPAPEIDRRATRPARFVTGSIMRHVAVMAGTGAIGMMAVFAVDLLNFYYISRLRDPALTAAIGFAGAIGYVQIAVSIGMTIGLGAVTGRLIGARQARRARRLASAFLVVMFGTALVLGMTTALLADWLLGLLGATGEARAQAAHFLHIVAPALPLVCMGMAQSALLRSVGDARRAMQVTLVGAIASAILDPIMIFVLHWALTGAAISTLLSRSAVIVAGFVSLRGHHMLERPRRRAIRPATRRIGKVALPAIATNLATPIGTLFTTHFMSRFGLNAISGQATIDRIVPVAFALVFALTGSVGPIMSQNLGAGLPHRVRETLGAALKLTALCVLTTWAVLAVFHNTVIQLFGIHGVGADIVRLFCCWLVASYFFIGLLFVANTAFNNLGHPLYSTGFNWGRATFGTIPFVWIGAHYGPIGILYGQSLGVVIIGTMAVLTAFRVIRRL